MCLFGALINERIPTAMELKKKATQESALAEFFKNPLQPFENPIIKENTDRYRDRDKLNNAALLQVLGKLGKKQDQKMVTMMEISQVYFYTIPLITVEIKKEMRFLTNSTPLKRESRFEKHWSIPTPKQKEFLTVHKIKLPKALWVDCDRCNTESVTSDAQEVIESCLCGDTGLIDCYICAGSGRIQDFKQINRTTINIISGPDGQDEEVEDTEVIDEMDESECELCHGDGKLPCESCSGNADNICRSCANGVHRELKIRTQYSFATKLATSNFIDQEITSWIEGLRPRGQPVQIDLRSLNERTAMNRKLKQKVDKMAEEINRRMDSNSLTQAKSCEKIVVMDAEIVKLALIPVHVIEYKYLGTNKKKTSGLGRCIIAGRDCKIKSILRPEEIKSTEKFIRRDNRFKEVAKRMRRIASVRDENGEITGDPRSIRQMDIRRTFSVPPWNFEGQHNTEHARDLQY
ncbi:Oidioi.mRNA.OKI2018_I69.XSR.g15813.t1.cds [Oikopleura dioica]|uniref:Oidioi.mRNA.OKI2018_I69.XSR.g15813.t1.cds n=1 Tax=Oikopleura dioica TaxID=34765 RepID=A0ABN7SI19_OIKDI|nr:Oidioi.mRNA.OKI2018_I69.XSR.g15813.t1.cds [Oikopleura dioica]